MPQPQPQHLRIRAASVTYTTAHSNAGCLAHWARPGIEPSFSWTLARFITAGPQWELLSNFKRKIFQCNTWTRKTDWRANPSLEFVGKELPLPWHFGIFCSHFLRSPLLSSLAGHSRTAGNILCPLRGMSFVAQSKHVFKSSEVINVSFQLPEP